MQNTIIQQGYELLTFGMGTVFVFLSLLIVSTTLMSAVIQKFWPEAVPVPPEAPRAAAPAASDDAHLVTAISAAIHKYRARHKK